MTDTPSPIHAGDRLARMRETAPLVHNITNDVSMNFLANVLLAVGASPAMVQANEEVGEFAALADALAINIGTITAPQATAMETAVDAARSADTPWVLDPVALGATAYRRELGSRLVELGPAVIRGNASEILTLAGAHAAGRGVDTGDTVTAAETGADALARHTGAVVAVTGPEDYVTNGVRALRIANGHAMMPRVTAMGCALTGVVAAFVAAGGMPLEDTAAALAGFAVAGEHAGERAAGPGSFAVHFIDALYTLDPATLDAGAHIRADRPRG
ncbi:hydroxyethylthiazole kinase [Arhodomonas aquaeolei]|uniref:hydroxyethylthiazole kinase n=1 Tax=Arhodomonas aquaeolei TaxID=2369 RepID=UPI0003788303|nr:hydroxyethylthiazole kinase [Arhodomonas aquaeolei]